ncbi:hypothetical protein DYB25_009072 [Aphanomyces astaci]|uniref:Uncharacterized protein n=1 Tax=Aphanomyces astaci TaxID=112090 RepID=A0A397AZA2_APHAT|nr:hypothetical protein DYB25_009072 [Aphanomyces astaci]RHY13130.1 hypothetical protein DYB36_007483 [Aphanomyces astaci]RHY68580.1 hypothetical protein DYB30_004333 [Aphanomyces astaci]
MIGGRANYLTVQVALRACEGIGSVSVPLRMTLLFESVVDDQDIFRIMGSNTLVLNGDDSVSRRKDGQRFKLKIDVDPTRSVLSGVTPVVTTPICVLSKRKSVDVPTTAPAANVDSNSPRKQLKHGEVVLAKQIAAMQAQLSRLMGLVEAQVRIPNPSVHRDVILGRL